MENIQTKLHLIFFMFLQGEKNVPDVAFEMIFLFVALDQSMIDSEVDGRKEKFNNLCASEDLKKGKK